jgi:hypothetical protein
LGHAWKKQPIPFFRHHQKALNHEALENLGTDSLEQSQGTFVLDDVTHDLAKGFEGLSIPLWGRFRLKTNFGNNEGLCADCG